MNPLLVVLSLLSAAPAFELHEWGTFTSVAGVDGKPMPWVTASTQDLPSFVHHPEGPCPPSPSPGGGRGSIKGGFRDYIRMETPVIYFYATEPLEVSLLVRFPQGRMTEWYPQALALGPQFLNWHLRVDPSAKPTLPTESAPSHYYAAREVDAAPVLVKMQQRVSCSPYRLETTEEWERYLFYRGVGDFQPPVNAVISTKDVRVSPSLPLGQALLFERHGPKVGVTAFDGGKPQTLARPRLNAKVEDVRALLVARLMRTGLFEKEARAMVKTWDDSWFEEGVRIFYLVPQERTDVLLPLALDPAPKSQVRTMVGRLELLAPERIAAVKASLPSPLSFAQAVELERALGRFGGALIERAAEPMSDSLRSDWNNAHPLSAALE